MTTTEKFVTGISLAAILFAIVKKNNTAAVAGKRKYYRLLFDGYNGSLFYNFDTRQFVPVGKIMDEENYISTFQRVKDRFDSLNQDADYSGRISIVAE